MNQLRNNCSSLRSTAFALVALLLTSTTVSAQSAGTQVDVGPGHAGASATADGLFKHTDTESRVGDVNLGRGFAVGLGPNGLSLSHSIGVNKNGHGIGHNFNLSIGPNGSHVSHGGVLTQGGNSRVVAGGQTANGFYGPYGGSTVSGFGHHTRTRSGAFTRRRWFPRW